MIQKFGKDDRLNRLNIPRGLMETIDNKDLQVK